MRLTLRPVRVVPAVLAVLLGLTACSSGAKEAGPTPSATTSPTPGATAAPTVTPTSAVPKPGRLSAWKRCDVGFECATLTVPLDDAHPAQGTVALALTRHRATGKKIGSLIANPGGPGASAVDWIQGSYDELPATIRQHFDVVAFDPRGVGRTAPVRCLTTPQLDRYFHLDPVPDDQRERAALLAGNKVLATGCERRSGRVLPHVSTVVVAQDLDRVRQAVGDDKLTYLGYSYGTAIGASYLDQFPTRVRAMVLDGALDPTLTWNQFLEGQSAGFDGALDAFLDHCQRTRCAFRRAVSGDLHKAYDALAARVEVRDLPGDGSRTVGPDEFSLGTGAALYSRASGWPYLAQALADAQHGDGAAMLDLSDSYLERGPTGYTNITEANFAVNCIDRPWPRAEAPYYALAAHVRPKAPRFGPFIALSGLGCAVWPVGPVSRPHRVTAPGSPPVVVIGTTRDPATPYAWAQGLSNQLSRAVLITHVGDGHTVYREGAPACLLKPVNAYLVSLTVPHPARC